MYFKFPFFSNEYYSLKTSNSNRERLKKFHVPETMKEEFKNSGSYLQYNNNNNKPAVLYEGKN